MPTPPTRATTTARGGRSTSRTTGASSSTRRPTGTTSDTGYFQGGLGWYRKTFTLPRSAAHKSVSLEFDGVYMDSVVFLNGKQVASHPYGYTGFAVDLTDAHADGHTKNVVAVEVRNKLPSSRWYSGSGIYRNVHLVVTDPVHVARHGTFVTTPDVESTFKQGFAKVHVAHGRRGRHRRHERRHERPGRRAADRRAAARPATPQDGSATSDLRLSHPHLWSTDDPYLYTLTTEVRQRPAHRRPHHDHASACAGSTSTPAQGFSLNGRSMKLYGVDLHHDEGALGAAVNKDALMRQMRTMKSMGVNAFRTSHNPPSPEMIEVCQELGIVMMVEAFDTWRTPKRQYDYGRFFDANSDSDIAEMVNAAKNSPAVVLWSIGNEIPDSTSATVGLPIAKRLVADIKAIDTTRPIVIGSDKYRSVPATGSGADLILGQLDGLGLNYNTAASVDALHAKYPNTFLFESESSSETSTRGVYQDPDQLNTGENYTPGKRATSSYDNNLASWTMSGEYGLKKDRDRKYFQGQFLWSGTDYIGEPTPYNVFPVKSSFFGAVDTAGFPKDAYWLFRSQWTKDPMVHLLPMNWTDHEPGEPVQVWAYANVDTVELFLNGHSLGVRRFDHKTTVDGRPYLETTEATGDDKTVTVGPVPGQLHEPQRQRRQAAPDLGRAVRAGQARRRRQPRRPPGRARRGRHRRAAGSRQAHARQARHRRRRALAVLLHGRRGRRPWRARPGRRQRDLLRRPRRRAPRRARQRPRGGRRELQGLDAPGVQRQGAGHRRLGRPARADHGDRDAPTASRRRARRSSPSRDARGDRAP